MFRLVYISTARAPITTPLLDAILGASRRNNARLDVTGLLVAGRNRFLQMLEGEEGQVRALYQRVSADPRHIGCVVLRAEHCEMRLCPGWDMGSVGPGPAPDSSQARVARALIERIEDRTVQAEFASFLNLHDRAA